MLFIAALEDANTNFNESRRYGFRRFLIYLRFDTLSRLRPLIYNFILFTSANLRELGPERRGLELRYA